MRIEGFEVYQTDLPFRQIFKHARAARRTSHSLFLRCTLQDGTRGYGECLPRSYVTGETREQVFELLTKRVLPVLFALEFDAFDQVQNFCANLYGFMAEHVAGLPRYYGATCCAVELALLDSFGRFFDKPAFAAENQRDMAYSGVLSASTPPAIVALALRYRAIGVPHVKLKVGSPWDLLNVWLLRRCLPSQTVLRTDANGAWQPDEAIRALTQLKQRGLRIHEQPIAPDQPEELRRVQEAADVDLVADEDLRDWRDAQLLAQLHACRIFNLRLSKCGGYYAALRMGELARRHGIRLQIGCQVGESALLSAAGLAAARALAPVEFIEGCFGEYLLFEDVLANNGNAPAHFNFGPGGRPPPYRPTRGLGIDVNHATIVRHSRACQAVKRN